MKFSNIKIDKKRYLQGFGFCIILLALVRCAYPSISKDTTLAATDNCSNSEIVTDSVSEHTLTNNDKHTTVGDFTSVDVPKPNFVDADGNLVKHRIYSVASYKEAFPDSNHVQIAAAKKWGVSPVKDRDDAERRKMELVYVGSSPYYFVEPLRSSIPYLVPRAAILLQDIGRNYFDSLQIKGVPLHKPIVTSMTRTTHDVAKLRNYNRNATENSCHLYGTTFDISYNRYKIVTHPNGSIRHQTRNDTLKFVLSEVLNDLRKQGRCYVKYEVKQGCFHITVR